MLSTISGVCVAGLLDQAVKLANSQLVNLSAAEAARPSQSEFDALMLEKQALEDSVRRLTEANALSSLQQAAAASSLSTARDAEALLQDTKTLEKAVTQLAQSNPGSF